MPTVSVRLMGRFGNQLFQYAFARGYARAVGSEFECDPWIGSRIFNLDDKPISGERPRRGEEVITSREENVDILCYAQNQACLNFYSKADVQEWYSLRDDIAELLSDRTPEVAIHLRRGDYWGAGYPIIGIESYLLAMKENGISAEKVAIISEENPLPSLLPSDIAFLEDFYALVAAKVHFRSNSTFSWWAAAIGGGRVFSPVIDGLVYGVSHNRVRFVEGNHARIAELPFITELHLQ